VSARRAEEEEEGISSGPPQPDRGFGRVQHQDAVGYRSVQTGAVVSWVWRVTSVQIICSRFSVSRHGPERILCSPPTWGDSARYHQVGIGHDSVRFAAQGGRICWIVLQRTVQLQAWEFRVKLCPNAKAYQKQC
jgi:hypothetical protein